MSETDGEIGGVIVTVSVRTEEIPPDVDPLVDLIPSLREILGPEVENGVGPEGRVVRFEMEAAT